MDNVTDFRSIIDQKPRRSPLCGDYNSDFEFGFVTTQRTTTGFIEQPVTTTPYDPTVGNTVGTKGGSYG
jgi:hypothetical protein